MNDIKYAEIPAVLHIQNGDKTSSCRVIANVGQTYGTVYLTDTEGRILKKEGVQLNIAPILIESKLIAPEKYGYLQYKVRENTWSLPYTKTLDFIDSETYFYRLLNSWRDGYEPSYIDRIKVFTFSDEVKIKHSKRIVELSVCHYNHKIAAKHISWLLKTKYPRSPYAFLNGESKRILGNIFEFALSEGAILNEYDDSHKM